MMSLYERIESNYLAYMPGSWISTTPLINLNHAKMDFALKEVANMPPAVDAKVRAYFIEHET